MPALEFWYSIGSTYSYLSVMRIYDLAAHRGVKVVWLPFNVRHIMITQNNIPFKDKPEKSAYMWRDIERRAQRHGLSPTLPAPYPLAGLVLANQVATLAREEGWVEEYTRATYARWFERGQPAGEDPNLTESILAAGQDPERVIEQAGSDRIAGKLAEATDQAMALGIFGSPSFITKGELFWGDDRLEEALHWAMSA